MKRPASAMSATTVDPAPPSPKKGRVGTSGMRPRKPKVTPQPAGKKLGKAMSLDKKIELFLKDVEKQGLTDPSTLPWNAHFDGKEMSCLWGRLTSKIASDNNSDLKRSWASLGGKDVRQGKNAAKREVLWLKLKYPQDHCIN